MSPVLAAMAHHEAGHAVASVILGLPFPAITIKGGVEGRDAATWLPPAVERARLDAHASRAWRAEMQDYLTRLLAGDQAEARWRLRRSRRLEWRSDRTLACDLALAIASSPEEASALVVWLTLRARNLAAKPDVWPGVATVATTLLEREALLAADVQAIFAQAVGPVALERLAAH